MSRLAGDLGGAGRLPLALSLVLLALSASGCGANLSRTVDLAGTARVTFPYQPTRQLAHARVDGRGVLIAAATYADSSQADRYHFARVPTMLSACVMKFDTPVFESLGADERTAFVAALRDAFGPFGTIGDVTPVNVASLPGYELVLERPLFSVRWHRPRGAAKTIVRVALGQSSLSFLAVRFDREARPNAADALEAFDALAASLSLGDRAPLTETGTQGGRALAEALGVLASSFDRAGGVRSGT